MTVGRGKTRRTRGSRCARSARSAAARGWECGSDAAFPTAGARPSHVVDEGRGVAVGDVDLVPEVAQAACLR
jgi:hypothetical protein